MIDEVKIIKLIKRMGTIGIIGSIILFLISSYLFFSYQKPLLSEETMEIDSIRESLEDFIKIRKTYSKLALGFWIWSVIIFINSVGFLKFKNWARLLSIVQSFILSLGILIFAIRYFTFQNFLYNVLIIAFFIYDIYFFTRPKVKEQFR